MRLSLFAAAALCLSTLAAHADTITVYNASGLFIASAAYSGTTISTLSGTLTLDETTGLFTGANLLVGETQFIYLPSQNYTSFEPGISSVQVYQYGQISTPSLNLFFDTSSFLNYQGGSLASVAVPADLQVTNNSYHAGPNAILQYGSLTPAQTPEPSSIALLSTGLVGMFGVARRKYMSA